MNHIDHIYKSGAWGNLFIPQCWIRSVLRRSPVKKCLLRRCTTTDECLNQHQNVFYYTPFNLKLLNETVRLKTIVRAKVSLSWVEVLPQGKEKNQLSNRWTWYRSWKTLTKRHKTAANRNIRKMQIVMTISQPILARGIALAWENPLLDVGSRRHQRENTLFTSLTEDGAAFRGWGGKGNMFVWVLVNSFTRTGAERFLDPGARLPTLWCLVSVTKTVKLRKPTHFWPGSPQKLASPEMCRSRGLSRVSRFPL